MSHQYRIVALPGEGIGSEVVSDAKNFAPSCLI